MGHSIAKNRLQTQADSFKRGNVAAVEIGEVGFEQLCHCSRHGTEAAGEEQGRFHFLNITGIVEPKSHDQDKFQDNDVMKSHSMEAEIVGEKFFDVAVAVDKCGVDEQQQRHGGANAGGNGENGLLMFSSVERHDRQHENEQGAKMKRQMI